MIGLRRRKPDIPGLLPVFVLVIGLLLVSPALSSPPTAVMEAPTSPFAVADDQATGLQDLQHHYQLMNRDLAHQAASFGDDPTAHEAIQIARLALQQRETLLQELGHGHSSALFAQQHRNLDLSADLIRIIEDEHPSKLHESVELAKRATLWQAASLGLEWVDPVPLIEYDLPSEALLELASRHGVQLDAKTLARMHQFDEKPEPLRSALARFVDGFLAFETAARSAYADVDASEIMDPSTRLELQAELIQALQSDPVGVPSTEQRFQEKGIDLSHLLPTRNQFLDAIVDLHAALQNFEIAQLDECDPIQVAPVFSIDLTHCDNHYTENFVLMLDAGGSDIYHNNAGGNGIGEECDDFRATAALVDLGSGDDAIGNPEAPLQCGINGGGVLGAGFLFNSEGDNMYAAGLAGTNGGGAFLGSGFLLDAMGNDTYLATQGGVNGGAYNIGLGLLIDGGGADSFVGGDYGTNGGGFGHGLGLLFNSGGDSEYMGGDFGTNGGGGVFGGGYLVSDGGDNLYSGLGNGTNGGGFLGGIGFLLDIEGDDQYIAYDLGTNGGAFGGIGLLLDLSGSDVYLGGNSGTNGGAQGPILVAFGLPSIGFLMDFQGDDTYLAGARGTNGGSDGVFGIGLLLDTEGDDFYDDGLVTCWDCSMIPKGLFGAQVDSDRPWAG